MHGGHTECSVDKTPQPWPRLAGLDLSNPALVYGAIWLTTLWLSGLGWTVFAAPMLPETTNLVLANIATFAVIYLIAVMSVGGVPPVGAAFGFEDLGFLRRVVQMSLLLWFVGTCVEIYVAGGIPAVWVLTGDTRDYRNFGIPTIHGFLTAIYLVCMSGLFLDYCVTRRRDSLVPIALLFVWALLLTNRGVIIWASCQLIGVYLVVRRVRIRSLVVLTAAALALVLGFGFIGDIRSGSSGAAIQQAASPQVASQLARLPSGVFWVYLYVTTPLNNINANIRLVRPIGRPYYSTIALFPSVVRGFIYPLDDPERRYPLPLANEAFNTSTWYAGFLADFGVAGAIICVSVIQFAAVMLYLCARCRQTWAVLAWSALFQGLVLSVFADTVTSLVCVFQLVLAFAYRSLAIRSSNRRLPQTTAPELIQIEGVPVRS